MTVKFHKSDDITFPELLYLSKKKRKQQKEAEYVYKDGLSIFVITKHFINDT